MRKWLLVLVVVLGLPSAALAIPIIPQDFDAIPFGIGESIASESDLFDVAAAPPPTMGTLASEVFFNGELYTYVSQVTPSVLDASHLNTAFTVKGFTGSAGWSFSEAATAGGTGTGLDFLTATVGNRLHWLALDRSLGDNWDAGEPITFFFRSTLPPTVGDYNLLNAEAGTAQGFAPVPEPGTLMLVGSGLYGLYYQRKRRRQQL